MIKCYDLDFEGLKKIMGRHFDPKDGFSLSRDQLRSLSVSCELRLDINGNQGKMLAQDPMNYTDGTAVEGDSVPNRMASNINTWLTNPDKAKSGFKEADRAAHTKKQNASGDGINDRNGFNAKQEELGGSPVHLFVNSKHVHNFTEAVVKKSSTQDGIDGSNGRNIPDLLPKMGLSAQDRGASGNKEEKRMKNATGTLKKELKGLIGMAPHPDNRHGRKSYPNDPLPWYNMPMIFYFKGKKKDVAQCQQKVEAPNKEELAMLVKKREDAKNARLAKKMMKKK